MRNANAFANSNGNADRYSDGNANSDSNRYSDGNSASYANTYSDCDPGSNRAASTESRT
jgi:hypothetical protein